ncbi:MAG TPA: transposase [Treponemataceae bacterium]|nr:transposase [Treponemataceae bacterium]
MRKNRILLDGAIYHVSARVNNKEHLLSSPQLKILFQNIMLRAKIRFDLKIENFIIMNNHYHIMIRPGKGESLSKIMQWIMSMFARAYNKRTGRTGHFWGERYFSRIIYTLEQYLRVFEYLDLNPVRANLVDSVSAWPFGGIQNSASLKKRIVESIPSFLHPFLSTRKLLQLS